MNVILEKLKKLLKKFSFSENLLRYINGGEVLPSPFSAEEEASLVKKLESGNEAVKDELVEHNLRLVVYRGDFRIRAWIWTTLFPSAR